MNSPSQEATANAVIFKYHRDGCTDHRACGGCFWNPLHSAVCYEEEETVKKLIELGADVNAKSDKKFTPLILAVNDINLNITEVLLNNGADVNCPGASAKDTPLIYAARKSSFIDPDSPKEFADFVRIIKILFRNGADVNIRNSEGQTLLYFLKSYYYEDLEILEKITNSFSDVGALIRYFGKNNSFNSSKFLDFFAAMIVKRSFVENIDLVHLVEEIPNIARYCHFITRIPKCTMEIVKLKEMKIKIRDLSAFDIFDIRINKLSNYVKREGVLQLQSDSFRENFPMYAELLLRHIEKAKNLRALIHSAEVAFKKLIFQLRKINLPDFVVYEIVTMLDNIDLNNLSQVCMNDYCSESRG